MLYFFLFILLAIPATFVLIGMMISAPKYKGPVSDHFDGKRFKNPTGIKAKGATEVLKWMIKRDRVPWKATMEIPYGPRPLSRDRDYLRITFINHSTFLIQVDNLNIITDPIYSERTSPFTWAGPRRMRPPGIRFEDLPRIDAILLSHNHYDHLDLPTVQTLVGGHHPRIVTPLGVKAFLDGEGINGATDLDWWQQLNLSNQVKVTCVPAQHFSGRGSLDRDATLWCGYVLHTTKGNVYFAGDTGYNPVTFRQIGEHFQSMRASLLPIGAYKPEWFMAPVHISPEEAVIVHQEVRSQQSIATHFGTFPLADEGRDQPVEDLKKAMAKHQLAPTEFVALREGEALLIE